MPKHLKDYKDKEKARKTRNRQRRKNYAKTAGWQPRQWTEYEDRLVREHSMPDRELSALIGRSVQSIQVRRCRLNKGVTKDETDKRNMENGKSEIKKGLMQNI